MENSDAIWRGVNGNGSVSDAAIDEAIDAFELRLLIDRVRTCSGCAGDYEDPDRTAWPADEASVEDDLAEEPEAEA